MDRISKVHAIREKKKSRVVNILGMAPSANVDIAYGELWGINNAWIYGHSLDINFVMDGLTAMLQDQQRWNIATEEYITYLKAHPDLRLIGPGVQELTWTEGEIVKTTEKFPVSELLKLIPGSYSNSSISHALAYAALQEMIGQPKVDIINLYGLEIWASFDSDEYTYQRACVDFWIPFLYGKGIQVNIPAYVLYAKDTKWNMYGFTKGV